MDIAFYVCLAVGVLAYLTYLRGKGIQVRRDAVQLPTLSPLVLKGSACEYDATDVISDEDFEDAIEKTLGGRYERRFYVKIAGASFANPDGTSRTEAICRCKAFEQLVMSNIASDYSSHALAVLAKDGTQIGFIPDDTAGELLADYKRGALLTCFFRHRHRHPDTLRVVGATLVIVFMKPGQAELSAEQRARLAIASTS